MSEGSEPFYTKLGFGTRIGLGDRPAVIVIDMARAFCDPSYKVGGDQSAALEAIAEILPAAREQGVPVYFTTVAYRADYRDGGTFVEKVPALRELVVDDPAATEIDPRVAPVEGEVVYTKNYPSAFFQTHLLSMLIVDRIDSLILCGCSTSGCVRATAVDGVSYGYRIAVPVQAVVDRWPGPHEAALFDIDAKYGDVISVADAVEHLRGLPEPLGPARVAAAAAG